ncbi:hypothetical protein B0H16DRAFT_1552331 [Mycena metata]|uniref:Uncharacterized protein n=1 Tax=Mycena metata TaxID=1033252 RepID=A0AAD7IRF4_9AGAR|nr:hypothetical protein B0H16DRAFT_1552331 [Mycena metata]
MLSAFCIHAKHSLPNACRRCESTLGYVICNTPVGLTITIITVLYFQHVVLPHVPAAIKNSSCRIYSLFCPTCPLSTFFGGFLTPKSSTCSRIDKYPPLRRAAAERRHH